MVAMLIIVRVALVGCGSGTTRQLHENLTQSDAVTEEPAETNPPEPENTAPPTAETKTGQILVAYFSRTGNTETVAECVAELTGGDLLEIVPAVPYPGDYQDCLETARRELKEDSRPALSSHVPDISIYDTVFIGFPIWHANTPMVVRSFLEEYDLSGKTIAPFCTSGSSGIGQAMSAIRELCPDSTILDGLSVTSATLPYAENLVADWVGNMNHSDEKKQYNMLYITIGETVLTATLAENSSAEELAGLLKSEPLTIDMRDYGGFEKVGGLGVDLPRNDEQITTEPGDLILFQGNAFVIYYAPNSWNFTRLGKINDITGDELKAILGDGDVSVTLSLER